MKLMILAGALLLPISPQIPSPEPMAATLAVETSTDDGATFSGVSTTGDLFVDGFIFLMSEDDGVSGVTDEWVGVILDDGNDTIYRVDSTLMSGADVDFCYDNYGDGILYRLEWNSVGDFVSIN